MGPQARIFKKVVEFLGCLACLLGKYFTDIEARRVFLTRQKWSREWSLLHTIFWNMTGDGLAWITYGGYTIITLLFSISICIDSKSRPTYAEKIFLFIGSLMFFTVGGIVFASIDQVPHDLIDNAIVLGCLSFFVAFVFLIDMSEKMGKRRSNATQTDTSSIDRHHTKSLSSTTINSQANLIDSDESNRRNRDSMRQSNGQRNGSSQQTGAQVQQSMNPFVNPPIANDQRQQSSQEQSFTDYHHDSQPPSMHQTQQYPSSSYSEDVVETQTFPTAQQPVFSKVKQNPTPISHLETEPYRKILSRTNQPVSYTRYHDQAKHHNDPSFYDDFNSFRKQTYYQGPRVDQGKLMVIRDYSQQAPAQELQKHACNCQSHHCEENDDQERENVTIKSGYVSQVAKLWDSRMKSNEGSVRSHQKDIIGFNTVV